MIVNYKEDTRLNESIIDIQAKPNDEAVARVLEVIHKVDHRLITMKDDKSFLIDREDIYYIEAVDTSVVLYTKEDSFDIKLKLYELEEELPDYFIRINKSCIVNLLKVNAIQPDFGKRLILDLENKEKLIVNRTYVDTFKRKLNMR